MVYMCANFLYLRTLVRSRASEFCQEVTMDPSVVKEEKDTDLAYSLRRRHYPDNGEPLYLVYFKIDKVLPLIGPGD
jgi:hypothetical protein